MVLEVVGSKVPDQVRRADHAECGKNQPRHLQPESVKGLGRSDNKALACNKKRVGNAVLERAFDGSQQGHCRYCSWNSREPAKSKKQIRMGWHLNMKRING
jgi:hypothetical protein